MSLDMKSSLQVTYLCAPHSTRDCALGLGKCSIKINFNNASSVVFPQGNSGTDFCRDEVHHPSLAHPRNLWNTGPELGCLHFGILLLCCCCCIKMDYIYFLRSGRSDFPSNLPVSVSNRWNNSSPVLCRRYGNW